MSSSLASSRSPRLPAAAVLLLFALFLIASPVFAGGRSGPAAPLGQNPSGAAADPLDLIETLAAPEFGGRLTGTPGNHAAAEYLAETLAEAGLVPLSGMESMLDYYQQPVLRSDGPPTLAYRAVGAEEGPPRGDPLAA